MQTVPSILVAAAAVMTPLPRCLLAQDLGLRSAVVPGSTECRVSTAAPGWMVGLAMGEQEGVLPLPGGAQLGIVPMLMAGIGFTDNLGYWYSTVRFPIGTGAGLGFVVQALGIDPSASMPEPPTISVSPVGHLTVPALEQVADVFILFGQSNAEGYANVHDLPANLFATMPEARTWNENVGSWQPLMPGVNNTTLHNPNWCGPEMTLAEALTGGGNVVYLFKFAVGQTSLGPTPGPWNEWGAAANELYFEMMRRFDNARLALEAARLRPRVRGICMMQGENDAFDEALAVQYQPLLQTLVQQMRTDLAQRGVTETFAVPFVIGLINRDLIPTGFRFVDTVRAAQNAVIAAATGLAAVETTGLPMKQDNVHFATDGQMTLGKRMARQLLHMSVAAEATTRGTGESADGAPQSTPDSTPDPVPGSVSTRWVVPLAGAAALALAIFVLLSRRGKGGATPGPAS
ncbi:MAG: hypothetical protein KDC98_02365 [Planctomycetes bacterium]|nr:hypothetical protein [Planctomycetota bacterium]